MLRGKSLGGVYIKAVRAEVHFAVNTEMWILILELKRQLYIVELSFQFPRAAMV